MPDHLTDQELAEFARGQASPDQLLVRDDHLAECAHCRERLAGLQPADAILHWREGLADREAESRHLTYEELTARDLSAAARAHLRECADCREERAELAEPVHREPQPIPPAVQKWRWLVPLAVAAGIAATVYFWRPGGTPPPNETPLAQVRDAGAEISLLANDAVNAPAAIPASDRPILAQALKTGALPLAPPPADVQSKPGTLLGGPPGAEVLQQVAPVGVLALSDRPVFRWQATENAEWYRVEVFDQDFNQVDASGNVTTTEWTPEKPLDRGRLYEWQIRAQVGGVEIKAPAPPRKEARFRIVDAATAARIETAQRAQSHLLAAVLCAQAGLKDDASLELDALAAQNPGSALVEKLRASLR